MRKSLGLTIVAIAAFSTVAQAAKPETPSKTFSLRNGTSLVGDGVAAAAPTFAPEAVFTTDINLAGFVANGTFSDPTNSRIVVPLFPSAYVTGVDYIGLNYTALGASWQSDFVISTNQSADTGAAGTFWDYSPAPTTDTAGTFSGTGAFTNPSNQFSSGPFQVLPDGNLLVYVWDSFDDQAGADETVASGTLRITYSDQGPPPPTAPASIPAVAGGSLTSTLTAGEVEWYSFTWGGGDINLNTEGSLLTPTNDTEIGLYDAATGALIASDDDSGTDALSLLTGTLAAGDYLLAVSAYNTTYAGGYSATSTSANVGLIVVNGISIPEPTSLAMLGLVGLVARRRR